MNDFSLYAEPGRCPVKVAEPVGDPLAIARGIFWGCVFSIPFWVLIVLGALAISHR